MVSWLIENMLSELGCVVIGPATRVDYALAMIRAGSLDAVVLDLNLNGQRSYPVAEALLARGLPFVFSTGYAREALPDPFRDCPVLQKPFHQSELRDALAGLLLQKEPAAQAATPVSVEPSIAQAHE
jgi:CheY-like chemotaxis protein